MSLEIKDHNKSKRIKIIKLKEQELEKIIFPAGVLAESYLFIRVAVLVICIIIFIVTKKNLVVPTIVSAILLSVLTSV